MKSYVVIGLGRFGSETARCLCSQGCEVLALDVHADLVQQISNDVTHAAVADARDKEVLRSLGVRDFDCAIIAIGDSLSDSILATMNVKELGVPTVICKAHDETHRQVLLKLGADRVVIPEKEQAVRLAKGLSSRSALDYIELSDECGIIELPAPQSWVGKGLRELNVRAKLGINILAIRSGNRLNVTPAPDAPIRSTDVLVVLGYNSALEKVQKL